MSKGCVKSVINWALIVTGSMIGVVGRIENDGCPIEQGWPYWLCSAICFTPVIIIKLKENNGAKHFNS